MYGCSIKVFSDENKVISKVKVQRFINNNENDSVFTVKVGCRFVVKPLNKQKMKHRDRKVQVLSFNENVQSELRVNVKFLDSNRRGIIPIEDLDLYNLSLEEVTFN